MRLNVHNNRSDIEPDSGKLRKLIKGVDALTILIILIILDVIIACVDAGIVIDAIIHLTF